MKIAQRDTAVDCYYKVVRPKLAATQSDKVLSVMQEGRDYSLRELVQLCPEIDISAMSRTVNDLRKEKRLEEVQEHRKCTISGITITPSRLPVKGERHETDLQACA